MATYQVTCITRDGSDPDWRIDRLGFAGNVYDIDTVINWLLASDANQLQVRAGGWDVFVGVRQHPRSGRLFLATEPDGTTLNNLASLPECG